MSEKYKFIDPTALYFTTSTVVGWVDLFTRPQFRDIIIDSLTYCQREKGLVIHSWCLMTNHLHAIVSTQGELLSDTFRDFKKFTAKRVIEGLHDNYESRRGWMLDVFGQVGNGLKRVSEYKIWQDGNHPIILFSKRVVEQKMNYIHNNPVKAGFVQEPEHYLYSSAREYADGTAGILKIEKLGFW